MPWTAGQLRIWNQIAVVPTTLVFQLASSDATWVRVCSIGATHLMVGISPLCSAFMSSQVSDWREPAPPAAPKLRCEPLVRIRTLVPRLWNTSLTACCAPWPPDTIAITAPMPNTMPAMVSSVRTLLRHSARSASLRVVKTFMPPPPP